jgi:hypothetical protein
MAQTIPPESNGLVMSGSEAAQIAGHQQADTGTLRAGIACPICRVSPAWRHANTRQILEAATAKMA